MENIEREEPSEKIALTNQWREITKPGSYRYRQGQWKQYSRPRTIKAEQKKIEVDFWQRRNKLLWQRMENTVNKKTTEEIERRREFDKVTI